MSVYDKKVRLKFPEFSFGFEWKPLKQLVFVLLVIAFLAVIALTAIELLKPKAIYAVFYPNPLHLAESHSTTLHVIVSNVEPKTVSNAVLVVSPQSKESLIIASSVKKIPTFGANEVREFNFIVRPNPKHIATGTYFVDVNLLLGEKSYFKKVALKIETV